MSPAKSPVCKTFATLQLKFRDISDITLASQIFSLQYQKSLLLQVLSGIERRW
jgi:hypothetical protein